MSKNKSFIALEQNKKCSCKPSDLLDLQNKRYIPISQVIY